MSDINAMRQMLRQAETDVAQARARYERAEEEIATCRSELEALGLDPDKPLEPQLDELRQGVDNVLKEIEGELAQLQEAVA